jgi:drug/metabolite transporter (DMT)-like permease
VLNSLVPVVALVVAGIVLGEEVSAERGVGAAFVVAGVAIAAGMGARGRP